MLNGDRFRRFAAILVAFATCVAFSGLASAQSTSASVSGRITDSSGAALEGAEVILTNVDTEALQRTISNGEGFYSFPNVAPGNYLMSVHKQSFRSVSVTGITLDLQDKLSRNFVLPVGSISESITVTADSISLNTTDATVSTVIDQTYIKNMPLNGRSFQDLILLTPGVVSSSPQNGTSVGNNGEFSVNGQRTESNYYIVDGVSANTGIASAISQGVQSAGATGSVAAATALGTTQALVSVDDLQEFRVQSSTYSAEYGRNSGGQIAFETKSGTNLWHGTAYDYLRNDAFDASNWFNNFFGTPQQALRQNDFGGTLGGPVRIPHLYDGKDKTFFFVSYEGLRLTQPEQASVTGVPDDCMRGIAGPTSCANLNPVLESVLGITRAPAGPTLLPVVNAFPLANRGELDPVDGLAAYVAGFSSPSSINSTSIRFDQVVNDKMTGFFRFSDTNSNIQSRAVAAPEVIAQIPSVSRVYTAGVNNIFSSQISNEFRLNYTSSSVLVDNSVVATAGSMPVNADGSYNLAAYLGLGAHPTAAPEIVFTLGNYQDVMQQTSGIVNQQRQWNLVDTVSYSVGAHQFKFGVDYRRLAPILVPGSPTVLYNIQSEPAIEQDIADGQSQVLNQNTAYPLFTNFSAFAQDNWKVWHRLTLSFGVRWEVNPPPGVTRGVLPYTIALNGSSNPSNWALASSGTPLWHTTWFNFAPRLGVAYVIRDTPGWETVVRGGGGVFFDSGQQLGTQGFFGQGYFATQNLPSPSPFVSGATCTPTGPTECIASQIPNVQNIAGYVGPTYGFSPHLQLPYTLQWNVSVMQALGEAQALTVSYVGAHGSRLLQANTFLASPTAAYPFLLVQNGSTSDYGALQVQFQRRLARGLTVLASYSWSHCIDWGSANIFIQQQRGNCDFDIRHNLSTAFSYDLANIGQNKFVKAILDHWGVDDRFTARTAFPVFLQGNPQFNSLANQEIPGSYDTIPGQPLYLTGSTCNAFFSPLFQALGTPNQCPGGRAINPCAFYSIGGPAYPLCPEQNPTVGGLAPRNQLRAFDAVQMDLAIRREFPIHDRLKLQFRAEAFNVFNHPNFGHITTAGFAFGLSGSTLNNSLGGLSSTYQMGGPRSMQLSLKVIF